MGHGGVQARAAPAHPHAPAAFSVLSLRSVHPSRASVRGARRCWPAARGELLPPFAEVVPTPRAPGVRHGDRDGDGAGATPVSLGGRLECMEGPIPAHPRAPANLRGGWRGPGFDAGPEPGRGPASGTPRPALIALLLPGLNKFSILLTFSRNPSSPVDPVY